MALVQLWSRTPCVLQPSTMLMLPRKSSNEECLPEIPSHTFEFDLLVRWNPLKERRNVLFVTPSFKSPSFCYHFYTAVATQCHCLPPPPPLSLVFPPNYEATAAVTSQFVRHGTESIARIFQAPSTGKRKNGSSLSQMYKKGFSFTEKYYNTIIVYQYRADLTF